MRVFSVSNLLKSSQSFGALLLSLTLLLLLVSCSDNSSAPEDTPEDKLGSLQGAITEISTDGPVAGATVFVVTDEFAVVQVTETDDEGEFGLNDLPAGSYLIYALDEHHLLVEWHEARVHINQGSIATVDLLMEPSDHTADATYRIEGRVTDAHSGAPLAGAWVLSTGYGEAGNSVRYLTNNSGLVAALSSADGSYSLPAWPIRSFYPEGSVIGLGADCRWNRPVLSRGASSMMAFSNQG